jgi:hypothetical protein
LKFIDTGDGWFYGKCPFDGHPAYYACPEYYCLGCKKAGRKCPDWISGTSNGGDFEAMNRAEMAFFRGILDHIEKQVGLPDDDRCDTSKAKKKRPTKLLKVDA